MPTAKKVGIVYSCGEVNSEIQQAPQSLGAVEAIYVPIDNTIVSALGSVLQIAIDMKIPVIGAEADIIRNGAIAAQGINYFTLGKQTGEMVVPYPHRRSRSGRDAR